MKSCRKYCGLTHIPSDMCDHRKLRKAYLSAQSDQSSEGAVCTATSLYCLRLHLQDADQTVRTQRLTRVRCVHVLQGTFSCATRICNSPQIT